MSATAQRWWVRLAARWLARIDGVKGQVQMFSLAVTAFSTFGVLLQGFGLGQYVPYIGVVGALGLLGYTYVYAEGGVWNQVNRDRADLSSNYAGPSSRINNEMTARALYAAIESRELTESERQSIKHELDATFTEHRDGINLEGVDD